MDMPVSASLEAWLNRKSMRGNGAGTPALHRVGKEPRAKAPGQVHLGGNSGKAEREKIGLATQEPSPVARPVVLRLIASNSTLIPTKPVEMNLKLLRGGKE